MRRKARGVRLLAALLALTGLPGCERPGDGGGRGEGDAAPSGSMEGRDSLVVGAGEDQSPSGAFQARLGVYPLNANVAETLTRLTPDFEVEPLLATRWEPVDARTWRFHLRPGVRFHDGQPLGAEAVRQSLETVLRQGLGYGPLEPGAVRAVDDSTVEITSQRPDLRLPERLVHPNWAIFAPDTDPAQHPVGTGPFRWVEYRPHRHVAVERNDDYWGDPPRLRRIVFRFYPDATTRTLALMAGEVDLIMDLPREQVPAVEERDGLRVARAEVGQMLNLHLNLHGREPYGMLEDPLLRRAVALGIDRQRLVDRIWNGEGEAVQNMTVPAVLGRWAERVAQFPFHPERSARLLDRAGWPRGPDGIRRRDGERLRLELMASPELDAGTAEYVQAALRSLGADAVLVRPPDAAAHYDRLVAGRFHLNLALPNQNDGNPLFLPALIFHGDSDRPFARWHLVGSAFDSLVNAGLRAEDPDFARRLAAEAIALAMVDSVALVSLAGRGRLYGLRASVEGFEPHPSQTNQSWTGVWLREEGRE